MMPNDFIVYVAPKIKKENEKRGYPLFTSVVIAQAILETGWGSSAIMMKANAIFGIKAGTLWRGKVYSAYTKEVYNFNSVTIKDTFRAYNSIEDSIADYFNLITGLERYQKALFTNSAAKCIEEIRKGGYATDPEYDTKVLKLINRYRLTDFDEPIQDVNEMYKVGKTYQTHVDLKVRTGAGTNYGIKAYKDLTANAKLHAYKQNNAVLKSGTKVTVLDIKQLNNEIWLRIPSGWIAGYYKGEYYVR